MITVVDGSGESEGAERREIYIYTHAHTDDTPVVKIGLLAQRIVSRLITNYLRNEQLNTGWQRAN